MKTYTNIINMNKHNVNIIALNSLGTIEQFSISYDIENRLVRNSPSNFLNQGVTEK